MGIRLVWNESSLAVADVNRIARKLLVVFRSVLKNAQARCSQAEKSRRAFVGIRLACNNSLVAIAAFSPVLRTSFAMAIRVF